MKIVRRYVISHLSSEQINDFRKVLKTFKDVKCTFDEKYVHLNEAILIFTISEDNEMLNAIETLIKPFQNVTSFDSFVQYTKKELDSAEFFHIYLKSYQGYLDDTDYAYDSSKECSKCGSGIIQIKPFTFGRKFDISKKKVGGLFNAYDEFFFLEETAEEIKTSGLTGFVFKQCINKKGEPLPVFQLKPEELFPYSCSFETQQEGICPECGTERFCKKSDTLTEYSRNGEDYELKDCYYSKEWYGAGHLCIRSIYISQKAKKVFDQIGIKNLNYEPIFEVK